MDNDNNFFNKLINKTKNKISNILLEQKIESKFKEKNITFTLYMKDNIFPITLTGYYENNNIIVYGNNKVPLNSVIVNEGTKTTYYVTNVYEKEIKIILDNNEYKRKGLLLELDNNIHEVNVIKAGKKYYLSKF